MAAIDNKPGWNLPLEQQRQCQLFSMLPPEIRALIFGFTLSSYEDLANRFKERKHCYRPEYRALIKTDARLLRTCQKVYNESWFLPWTLREHVFHIACLKSLPPGCMNLDGLRCALASVASTHGWKRTQIPNMRIFLEISWTHRARDLQIMLKMNHFRPTTITITIGHADWPTNGRDPVSHISDDIVNYCEFPDTVEEINLELEARKSQTTQVQEIANLIKATWVWTRMDGTRLTARMDTNNTTKLWESTSITGDKRLLGEEIAPGRLLYFMRTLVFRVDRDNNFEDDYKSPYIELSDEHLTAPDVAIASLDLRPLRQRHIAFDAPKEHVWEMLRRFKGRCWCTRYSRRAGNHADCCTKQQNPEIGWGWVDSVLEPASVFCMACQGNCHEFFHVGMHRRQRRRFVRDQFRKQQQAQKEMQSEEEMEAEDAEQSEEDGETFLRVFGDDTE